MKTEPKDSRRTGKATEITGFVRNSSPNDILISICLSFCYVDNLILQYIRYEMTPTSVGGEQHS